MFSLVAIVALISTGCKKTQGTAKGPATTSSGIVYVELDSVIAHFDMATDKTNLLVEKQKNSEAELNNKSHGFSE